MSNFLEVLWKWLWVNYIPSESDTEGLEKDKLIDELLAAPEAAGKFAEKLRPIYKTFVARYLLALHPTASVRERAFTDEKKVLFLLKRVADADKINRVKIQPPFPEELRNKLMLQLKEEMMGRRSASSLLSLSQTSNPNPQAFEGSMSAPTPPAPKDAAAAAIARSKSEAPSKVISDAAKKGIPPPSGTPDSAPSTPTTAGPTAADLSSLGRSAVTSGKGLKRSISSGSPAAAAVTAAAAAAAASASNSPESSEAREPPSPGKKKTRRSSVSEAPGAAAAAMAAEQRTIELPPLDQSGKRPSEMTEEEHSADSAGIPLDATTLLPNPLLHTMSTPSFSPLVSAQQVTNMPQEVALLRARQLTMQREILDLRTDLQRRDRTMHRELALLRQEIDSLRGEIAFQEFPSKLKNLAQPAPVRPAPPANAVPASPVRNNSATVNEKAPGL